jgi:hypothetical protein
VVSAAVARWLGAPAKDSGREGWYETLTSACMDTCNQVDRRRCVTKRISVSDPVFNKRCQTYIDRIINHAWEYSSQVDRRY